MGYHGAAKQLSSESGYELEIPSVAAFRQAVLCGEWEEAEALLFASSASAAAVEEGDGGVMLGNGHSWRKRGSGRGLEAGGNGFGSLGRSHGGGGLPLADGADVTALKFLLRQQKYLELLEERDLNAALFVLRNELTPLKRDVGRLHALSR